MIEVIEEEKVDFRLNYEKIIPIKKNLFLVRPKNSCLYGLFSTIENRLILSVSYDSIVLSKDLNDLLIVSKKGLYGVFSISKKRFVAHIKYTYLKIKDGFIEGTLITEEKIKVE